MRPLGGPCVVSMQGKVLEQRAQKDLRFHVCEMEPDTLMNAAAKWEPVELVGPGLLSVEEPVRIEHKRVIPIQAAMVGEARRNDDPGPFL